MKIKTSFSYGFVSGGNLAVKCVAVFMLFVLVFSYDAPRAQAATYTFTQSSWSGGASATAATHPTNLTGWNQYNSKDSSMSASSGGVSLSTYTASTTQTSATDFNAGTLSNTVVSGSGDSASVVLGTASDWYNTSWTYRKQITIDEEMVSGSSDLTNFPVLINLTSDSDLSSKALSSGNDILFTSSNGTVKLSHEIEKYTSGTGELVAWVKVPTLSHNSDTVLYMYYGNSGASNQQDAVNVWDSNYKMVYHLGNNAANTSISDSTSNAIGATANANTSLMATTGKIGGAVNSSNGTQYASSSPFTVSNLFTVSAWVRTSIGAQAYGRILENMYNQSFYLGTDSSTSNQFLFVVNGGSNGAACSNHALGCAYGGSYNASSDWTLVTGVYNGSVARLYVNGEEVGSDTVTAPSSRTLRLCMMVSCFLYGQNTLAGRLDEVRISDTNRSAGWVATEFNNQNSPATYTTLGSETGSYASSGTYTTSVLTLPSVSWNTVSWTATTSSGSAITFKARSSSSATMTGVPAFSSCSNITSGGSLSTGGCVTDGDTYLQLQATLNASTNRLTTPYLNNFLVTYTAYPDSQTLISSAYDSGSDGNIMGQFIWTEDAALPANTTVTVSLRTASSSPALASASWTNLTNASTNCSKASGVVTCTASALPASMKDGSNDQWFQYKITLTSNGSFTPTVTDISIQYVVNAPPEFNPDYPTEDSSGVSAEQVSDSSDPNYGKVRINYSVKDVDGTTGTFTPSLVTPTIAYNIGEGWVTIAEQYLNEGDLDDQEVEEESYTVHSAYWNAKAQVPNEYLTTAQVRVTIDDNEAANNTATAASANFILDTIPPVNSLRLDVRDGILYATSTDNSILQYVLSNNADSSADGLNAISGTWVSTASTTVATSTSWTFASSTYPTVYFQTQDAYNSTTTAAAVAPARPVDVEIHDVSNVVAETYKEFVSWNVYTATSSAAFSQYRLFRSADGGEYSQLTTVSDVNTNYFLDTTTASSSTYSYKVVVVDTDGDISAYSDIVSDQPNGQGGSDSAAPVITSVTVAESQSTWARITWTTDELSNSRVEFSATEGEYGSSQTVESYVTNHSVVVSGLTPNTTYYFRVLSTDIAENTATDDNNGNGYTLATNSGPAISSVSSAPTDTGAVITWNTNRASDSYVFYSTNSNLSGAVSTGSDTLVATSTGSSSLFQHQVTLSGLNPGTAYYFYVESTDSDGNTATDNNDGSYYNFQTTTDTNAPTITNITVPLTTSNKAAVVWTTSEPATSRVEWGTSSGSYSTSTEDSTLTTSHMLVLSDLSAEAVYYFVVTSEDSSGNSTTSPESEFTSAAENDVIFVSSGGGGGVSQITPDTTPPTIGSVSYSSSTLTSFGVTITFTTNEDSLGIIEYGTSEEYNLSNALSKFQKDHSITLVGLRMGTLYHFRVKVLDKAGNESVSADHTFTTKFLIDSLENVNVEDLYQYQEEIEQQIASILPSIIPPFIGKVEVSNITQNSVDITWDTNIKSFSSIEYAPDDQYRAGTDKPYAIEVANTSDKIQAHTITLVNLQPNTRYHFRVKAYTLPEASSFSEDVTFVTRAGDISAYIADVQNTSFRVVWTTPDPSDGVVEYRNTVTGEINRKVNENQTTFHEVVVDNLQPGTAFTVRVTSVNNKGNLLTTRQPLRVVTGQDTAAPEITGLRIENTLVPGAADKAQTLVRWTTNELASTIVFYEEGSGAVQGDRLANRVNDSEGVLVTDHIAIIGSLKAGSIYRIQVESTDQAGNVSVSPVKTIVIPRQEQSVSDIIFKNFEDSFKFLRRPN